MRGRASYVCGLVILASGSVAGGEDVTGADVARAVRLGVQAIRERQLPDGSWPERSQPGGNTCLAALALLAAGERPEGPTLSRALAQIRNLSNQYVYTTSLKIMVLGRADPIEYRREIEAAAAWLTQAQTPLGLWGYQQGSKTFDHSNSQFALLGLYAAAEAGVTIRPGVWKAAQERLLKTQSADGGWGYPGSGESYGSMTAAGVADLLILGHRLAQGQEHGYHSGGAQNCGKYRTSKPLAAGMGWLERNFRVDENPQRGDMFVHYWLYTVERCGILAGQQRFGPHDWYRSGAAYLVRTQGLGGLWENNLTDTCFGVLFLAKGDTALLIQKLRWSEGDDWNPDRYDVAHLVAFIGDRLGEPVGWQAVGLDAPLEEWLAAPLLYMQGHKFPALGDAQRAKLRAYVEQGGTLLAEACCSRAEFRAGFEAFAAATFPDSPLRMLGPEHAVYSVLFPIRETVAPGPVQPDLLGIDYGCRTAVIFAPRDLSCLWEQGDVPGSSERAFQLGANIAAYAVGRRPLRDRLDAVVLPKTAAVEAGPPAADALRLAQVVYEGDWRPFPAALPRLAEFLRDAAKLTVVTEPAQIRLTDAGLYASPVLVLAGHHEFELSEAERTALAAHLRRGGFLMIDACCGPEPFETAVRRMLAQTFPEARFERLSADHPILTGEPGFDVRTVRFSADVLRARPGLSSPELWGLELDGRLAAVYSPYSLSCGLAGPAFDGCWGLASEDARRVAANIVLYALTH